MNLLAIGIVVHFISTTIHPRVEDMGPQANLTLLAIHSPHTTIQKPMFFSHDNSNPLALFPTSYKT
jgi:hypothetical protein